MLYKFTLVLIFTITIKPLIEQAHSVFINDFTLDFSVFSERHNPSVAN